MKKDLQALTASAKEATQPVELDQARTGRLTRMDAMQAQQMAQAAERRRQKKLVDIEAALQRIAAGDYGDCLTCGEPINPRRLAIDPTHTLCIRCAENT